MPRLLNDGVFEAAIARGIETQDFLAYASGKDGDKYLGFAFGRSTQPVLDQSALLIELEAARLYQSTIAAPTPSPEPPSREGVTPTPPAERTTQQPSAIKTPSSQPKRHFYGVVSLDPIKAKMDFATIVDEIIQNFNLKSDVKVKISVDIQAESTNGFDENLQRTIRENCSVLRFNNAEFDEG